MLQTNRSPENHLQRPICIFYWNKDTIAPQTLFVIGSCEAVSSNWLNSQEIMQSNRTGFHAVVSRGFPYTISRNFCSITGIIESLNDVKKRNKQTKNSMIVVY